MNTKATTAAVAAALLVLATGGWAVAQHQMQHGSMMQNGQHMGMQNHMSNQNGMMQQMSEMMGRSKKLSQTLGQMMKTHRGQMGDQIQTMQQMSESMGTMAQQMKADLQRCNQLLQDQNMMKNQGMHEQMGNLRDHMDGMATQMNGALDNLESITKTLDQGKSSK